MGPGGRVSPIAPALELLTAEIAELTAQFGRRVDVAALGVTDRAGQLPLSAPGLRSPNGACRLVPAADGWIAVNLAREEDAELIPAWLGCEFGAPPWTAIAALAGARPWRTLVAEAQDLGLPVAGVGEVASDGLAAPLLKLGVGATRRAEPLKVVDLSALWAGPLCGAILAAAGGSVAKVESLGRPDPTRTSTPEFFRRLNGGKADVSLDLRRADGRAVLRERIAEADVVITSARPRGLASLGLSVEAAFAANPGLVWVAVTGYGFTGEAASRVAFGDDAAAAGGLVGWSTDGSPQFLGDALADPVTGLAAVVGALKALAEGGGVLVDASLAGSAAGAAAVCRLRRAA
ncbi:MAG: CoA transferase [Phenylobacterium sp.]|nr:MAG: CoA transferase [Phenylobacterium sp.]